MQLIVKIFPEIIIKSKTVRQRLVKQLRNNIRRLLKPIASGIDVVGSWDRITIHAPTLSEAQQAEVIDILKRTPGIHHFLRVDTYTFETLDDIINIVCPIYAHQITGKTFCVRAKRAGRHPFKSGDIERAVGAALYAAGKPKGVSLTAPEVQVTLEIKDQKLHIVSARYEGLGGYPLGGQESCLSLISGGFDSTVSSFLMMKRGVRTHFCFFNLGGLAHEVGVKQVAHYLWSRYGASQRVHFISVPFADVVGEILTKVHHSYMGVILKRCMVRAAASLAKRWDIPGLVTGESIAQVSSQTMINLSVIDQATPALILRPLACWDKEQIIRMAREIGTEDFAKTMPEYCGVISDRPHTAAKLEDVLAEEAKMDMHLLDEAVAKAQVTPIDQVMESVKTLHDVTIVATPQKDDVIIDVRHPDEQEAKPLHLTNNQVLSIPFYELGRKFPELDHGRRYLLYCDRGVMSQMQAVELKEKGHDNVLVYRP